MALIGCSAPGADDGRDDDFVSDGKVDGSIAAGSREANGVLAVANSLTKQELDDDVGLTARAANNIVTARNANTFDTLAELDAVPYVGPVAFEKLLAYATDNGFVDASAKYQALWSIANDDVWAVGVGGLVEHWNGTTWETIPSGVTTQLWDVWAGASNDVWIVGDNATALRWNGTSLQQVALPIGASDNITSVHGSSLNHVWFASTKGTYGSTTYRWNGSQFQRFDTNCQGSASNVHVASPTAVYVGGGQESLCRFNGTSWQDISPYQTGYPLGLADTWVAPSGTVYAIVGGDVFRLPANGSWSKMYSVPYHEDESFSDLTSFRAFSENDIWASGLNGHAVHWNGSTWTVMHADRSSDYLDIAGTSSTDLWMVGHDARAHFNGVTWTVSVAP